MVGFGFDIAMKGKLTLNIACCPWPNVGAPRAGCGAGYATPPSGCHGRITVDMSNCSDSMLVDAHISSCVVDVAIASDDSVGVFGGVFGGIVGAIINAGG